MRPNQDPSTPLPESIPLETLQQMVNGLFMGTDPNSAASVTRYIGGFQGRTLTFTRNSETGDCSVDYDDTDAAPIDGLEKEGSRNIAILAKDGALHDGLHATRPEDFDPATDLAPELIKMLRFTTYKPVGIIGRMALLRRTRDI